MGKAATPPEEEVQHTNLSWEGGAEGSHIAVVGGKFAKCLLVAGHTGFARAAAR